MFRVSVTLALALFASPSLALLSPFYDSAEKITTILQTAAVADALHQAPIGAVSNTGTAKDGAEEWTVRVQACDLLLRLRPIAPNGVGKTTYSVEIASPCQ